MSIVFEERLSDSPFIETITQGYTVSDGSTIRPSEIHWHMVFVKECSQVHTLMVGPLKTSGIASWKEGAEILWVKFKLGTFMPRLPTKHRLDTEIALPKASSQSFWLHGGSWQLPDFENVETFVKRLVQQAAILNLENWLTKRENKAITRVYEQKISLTKVFQGMPNGLGQLARSS
jgi:hypothetical protein